MTEAKNTEVMEPTGGAMEMIERAQVDVQIATAHQYPRSMAVFKRRGLEMVTMDEETAQSCIYRRPVGKDKGVMKYAEGKSIRMAEIVGACYGNIRVAAMLIEVTPRYVKARGMAHDLESNFAATSEVMESTVTANGQPYSERMRVVVAKAALSKARRDATFMVVPGALCKCLESAARQTAIGTEATIGQRRANVIDWINKMGIDPSRVWAALGIAGIDDVGLDHLETLTGLRTAIRDGDSTADEAFPAVRQATKSAPVDIDTAKPAEVSDEALFAHFGNPPAELLAEFAKTKWNYISSVAQIGHRQRAELLACDPGELSAFADGNSDK